MTWYEIVIISLMSLVGLALIVVVLLQKSDDDGIAGLSGTRSDSMRQNQARGLLALAPKLTVIFGSLLAALCIGYVLLDRFVF